MSNIVIYDCEIWNAIPDRREPAKTGISYCKGWGDFSGMGISTICAYEYNRDCYRVFCRDNFDAFQDLVDSSDVVVGYNSLAFDNPLCAASDLNVPDEKSYDLLVEIWAAADLGPKFSPRTHGGYGLDTMAQLNFGEGKIGDGALAPVNWQRGKNGTVIDYNLRDVWLTKRLTDLVIETGRLQHPKQARWLQVRSPFESHEQQAAEA